MEPFSLPDACKDCPTPAAAAQICTQCPERIVCRCLQVTERALVEAITTLQLTTLKEIRVHTGAGDGCTCCHHLLKRYLAAEPQPSSSAAPICVCK
ncbi:MAG TPA: (2Fe-2S)-binding protein [Gemmataceae bacterium]|nr:(2Fe-2S)-binding protein [Gemmataceae bacterium]